MPCLRTSLAQSKNSSQPRPAERELPAQTGKKRQITLPFPANPAEENLQTSNYNLDFPAAGP